MGQNGTSVANERTGWLIVALACVMVGMSYGSLLTVTVFLKPLEGEFGWLRGETSFAYMAGNIMAGMGGVWTGIWADRISTRSIVLIGSMVLGAAYVLLGLMQSLVEFYLVFGLVLGGLGVSAFTAPLSTSIGFWFDRNRGLAMSIMLAGQMAGGAGVPLLAGYFISLYGWRDAYLCMALVMWVALLPLCFLLRDPPGLQALKSAARANVSATQGQRDIISPWTLTLVLSVAAVGVGTCQTIPLVHLVPLVRELGYDARTAATVFGTMMGVGVVGRVVLGKVSDYIGGLRTLMLATAISAAALFPLTQTSSLPALYAIAAVFGFGFGGVLPSIPLIIRELVPAHLIGRTMGIVLFIGYMSLGAGGYMAGVLYDVTGNYVTSYAAGTGTGIFGLLVTLTLHLRVRRRRAMALLAQAA
ncbi:MAG: MFS transporter [Candidatus Lambdaproteobacteria bacterium]|nr:MFS transporter [Candidatus Lambdaproteobacteria bacterium]